MARPRCSKNDPKRFRSMGARVRLVSTYTRTGAAESEEGVCAVTSRLSRSSVEHPAPSASDCRKKRRRAIEVMEYNPPPNWLCPAIGGSIAQLAHFGSHFV